MMAFRTLLKVTSIGLPSARAVEQSLEMKWRKTTHPLPEHLKGRSLENRLWTTENDDGKSVTSHGVLVDEPKPSKSSTNSILLSMVSPKHRTIISQSDDIVLCYHDVKVSQSFILSG